MLLNTESNLKGKDRSKLKKMAHHIKASSFLGKNGVSKEFIEDLDNILEAHELVKINISPNLEFDKKELSLEVCKKSRSEFISFVGRKLVVYRKSHTLPAKDRIQL